MSSIKSAIELAINMVGNAVAGVTNLNNNFNNTLGALNGINDSVNHINSNIVNLSPPTRTFSEKIFDSAVGVNALLGIAQKITPAIMNAANAANVFETNINKAALSNTRLVQGLDGGYNNLAQNVTRFGNEAINAAMKSGNGIESVLNTVSSLTKGGLSETVSFEIYSDINNFSKGFQTDINNISGLYSSLSQLKGVDVSNFDNMKNAMNSINFTMNASKISIEEYTKMIKDNAPQFNAFGIGLEDVNKMVLHLANSGFSGNNIIQNIEQINKAIIKAQKKGKDIELNGEALLAYNHLLNRTQKDIDAINRGLKLAQANDYIGKIAAQISNTNAERINTIINRVKAIGAVFLAVFVPVVAFVANTPNIIKCESNSQLIKRGYSFKSLRRE